MLRHTSLIACLAGQGRQVYLAGPYATQPLRRRSTMVDRPARQATADDPAIFLPRPDAITFVKTSVIGESYL